MLPAEEIRLLKSFYKEEGISDLLEYFIDYSHIKDTKFREYLESINRKMIKARIRNDFGEYCRCAFMQIEAMTIKYVNLKPLDNLKSYVQRFEEKLLLNEKLEDKKYIEKVPLYIKIKYFLKSNSTDFDPSDPFGQNKQNRKPDDIYSLNSFISNLNELRNYLSHGDADRELDDYSKRILRDKDWNKIKQKIGDYYQFILKNKI